VLVIIPVTISTLLQERLYRSSTLIEIAAEPLQVLPYRDVASPGAPTLVTLRTQEEMLRGSVVASRVAARLDTETGVEGLADEIPRLGAYVSIRPIENSLMFRVSYLARRPEVAATVANVWAEEFIKANFASRQETREKVRLLLKRELGILEHRVQASEKELVKYAQEHNMQGAQGKDGDDLAQVKLSTLAGEVTSAESEIVAAQSRVETLNKSSVTDFPDKLATPIIASRQTALLQLEHELTALRSTFGENWPAVVQKRSEIALVREQLAREKATALAQAREQAMMDLRAAESKRSKLAGSMTQQGKLVAQLQDASVQYNIIRREVETNQKLYEGLLERLKQTGVAPGMEFENIRIIEPAYPDSTLASPRTQWNVFLASVLGLALGICFVLGRDFWGNAVASVEDLEQVTALPVLGTIPLVKLPVITRRFLPFPWRSGVRESEETGSELALAPSGPAPSKALAVQFMAQPATEEAVRNLCASILLSQSERPPQVLMVTSAVPGEGKTTIAGQLGIALADSGSRTLLVECDMRRPTFATVLGVGSDGGLSLFLAGHITRPRMHSILDDKLFVIPAGPTPPNPVALLHSEKMKSFLREVSLSFRFVILDAPPVLPMADARMLGTLAEGVVLVARAGSTSRRTLQRVCGVLEAAGANILGTVLNGADAEGPEGSYYRYYRRYYQK
jgi:capsular exopolysaccharide synthesis family protein